MSKDEFDAARDVAAILEGIDQGKRHQVIRWALEKLGMRAEQAPTAATPVGAQSLLPAAPAAPAAPLLPGSVALDIKSFIDSKAPHSQSELVATVAYYHHFEAPEGHRQDHVGEKELLDACRLAQRHRPGVPAQALVNACTAGLLDRVAKGRYKINSVGENLVAMVLPHKPDDGRVSNGDGGTPRRRGRPKSTAAKAKKG